MERSKIGRNIEGNRPSEARAEENGRREMNLPPLLAAHLGRNEDGQPPRSSLTSVHGGRQSSINTGGNLPPNDPTGSVTPFVRWIEEYPLPNGLKMPSHIKAREVATNGAPNDRRDNSERSRKPSWDNDRGQRSRDKFSPYRGPNHGLLSSLSKSPREILATEKVAKTFEQPPRLPRRRLTHLVKDIKKKKEKVSDTQLGEQKEERKKAKPAETHVLMISRKSCNPRKRYAEEDYNKVGEITFPPVTKDKSLADPVIIKAYVSGRQVNRVYMDSGSSCEVIYEHCFLKLKPSIRSLRVDSKTPLVGFSEEYSWPLGEVPLEITIGEGLLIITKMPNFVIVRSDSPHNLLLGRTAMQQMGIVVSTIHEAIKFHTPKGIGTLLSKNSPQGPEKEQKIASKARQADKEDILSCVDAEENIVVNKQYPEQTITIGRQLQMKTKLKLQELLKAHTDVFAWTTAHITGVPRTIINAGATYQRLIDKVFGCQVGRNMEVNADEMVIKSNSKEEMLADIKETLERLRVINLKLDPKKCSFGVEEGRFLGHLITKQGIKADPSKVKAISDLQPPKSFSEIQSLDKKLATINRFLSKGADKMLPFMRTLKNCTNKEIQNGEAKRKEPESENAWKLFTDGASSSDGSVAGLLLVDPEGKEYAYALWFEFETTNNEAEYEALLEGLRIAKEMKIQELIIFIDS
ncbi:reverse transcriptase domain-containing protein [Tanacetum coccineum]